MLREVMRVPGAAVPLQVVRRGHDEGRHRAYAPGDQRRIGQHGNPERRIETFAHQVDLRVGEMKIDGDLGVGHEEVRQERRDPAQAKGHGHRQAHQAARLRGHLARGVKPGDRVLDLATIGDEDLLKGDALVVAAAKACESNSLNALMATGTGPRRALRHRLFALLNDTASSANREAVSRHLIAQADVEMLLPAAVGDYSDFYASIFHATNVGKLFRPDNPLLPNYKYIPNGYHGRASSLVASETSVLRPSGQTRIGDEWQAWISVRSTGETLHLASGDKVKIGALDGKIESVEER